MRQAAALHDPSRDARRGTIIGLLRQVNTRSRSPQRARRDEAELASIADTAVSASPQNGEKRSNATRELVVIHRAAWLPIRGDWII